MNRPDFCRQLAAQAGAMAHQGFGTSAVSMKGRHDEVTAMDRAVEQFIRSEVLRAFPDDAVLGEEDGATDGLARAEHVWIIDPIDGTANFARGIAHYSVSIGGLARATGANADTLAFGALHDPSHQRLYVAERGRGAWLIEGTQAARRLAVSPVADIEAATVELGWSLRRPQADYLALVQRAMDAGCAVRRAGSGALGLADVAAGRIEGYAELHINAWDCAAGLLLVAEAGGCINPFFAGDGLLQGNPILATNRALGAPLAALTGIALADPDGL